MKIKQTLQHLVLLAVMSAGVLSVVAPSSVLAADNGCGTETAIIKCTNVDNSGKIENTGLWSLLLTAVNILTAGIGILAVAGIVYGSILYTSAGGSAEQTKKAIGIITNVVIGIVTYLLMYSFLNFIIPGGLFT